MNKVVAEQCGPLGSADQTPAVTARLPSRGQCILWYVLPSNVH